MTSKVEWVKRTYAMFQCFQTDYVFIINQDIDMVYLINTAVTDSDGNDGFFTLKLNSHYSAWQYSAKQLKMMENRA